MRQPTPREVLFRWHGLALSGIEPPRHEDEPQPGFYRLRQVRGGPWVPALIACRQVVDPETGELEEPETLTALVGDEPANPLAIWLRCRPIAEEAYDALLAAHRAEPAMAATHAPLTADALALGPARSP